MRAPSVVALLAALSALLATACASDVRSLPVPEGTPGAVVVVTGSAPRRATVAPYAAGQPALPLRPEGDEGAPLHTLYFAAPLPWAAGTYVESSDGWGRALPAPSEAFVGSWGDGGWTRADAALLVPFVMPLESPVACAQRGGCFADREATACTVPCPAPPEPALPALPQALRYAPCPEGWIADDAAQACRAYATTPPACAPGELRGAGGACTSPGPACGAGPFADGLDDAGTVFVQPGAVGGDGTRAAPLGTLEAALASAGAGAVIALSTGDHAAPARIEGTRRVVGACADGTRLSSAAALTVSGVVRLESLTLAAALTVSPDAALELRGARLLGPATVGERARVRLEQTGVGAHAGVGSGATLTAREASLSALGAARTASVSLDRAWVEGTLTSSGAQVSLVASVVRPRIRAADGALSLTHVVLDAGLDAEPTLITRGAVDVRARALLASGSGLRFGPSATVLLEDLRVDDAVAGGEAVGADDVALTVRRSRFGDGFIRGIRAVNAFAPVIAEDVVTPPDTAAGLDLRAPKMRLSRLSLRALSILQIGAPPPSDGSPAIELDDVTARDGLLRIRDGGRVRIRRAHFVDMRGSGLVLDASPVAPDIELSDATIEGTRATMDCPSRVCAMGSGIMLEGGSLSLSRFVLRGNAGPGLLVQTLTGALDVRDGTIEAQSLGILMEVPAPRMRDALVGVRLVDVARVCEPCGTPAPAR